MYIIGLLLFAYFALEVRRVRIAKQKAIELLVEQRTTGPVKSDYVVMLLAREQHARYLQMLADVDNPLKFTAFYLYLYFTRYQMTERSVNKLIDQLHQSQVLRLDIRTQRFYLN